jgi:hypothetical protein
MDTGKKKSTPFPVMGEQSYFVRAVQKSLHVGKYEVLGGVAQRERRHFSF